MEGSYRISAKKSVATISAADKQVVGCPLPASLVERTQSMRSLVAMLRRESRESALVVIG